MATPGARRSFVTFDGPATVSPSPGRVDLLRHRTTFTGRSVAAVRDHRAGRRTRSQVARRRASTRGRRSDATRRSSVDEMRRGAIIVAAVGVLLGWTAAGARRSAVEASRDPVDPGRAGLGTAARRRRRARLAARAAADPAGAGQSAPARPSGRRGTAATAAAGAGTGQRSAAGSPWAPPTPAPGRCTRLRPSPPSGPSRPSCRRRCRRLRRRQRRRITVTTRP